ncbi:unnamed protein product [Caenorhabditis nigoni]
MEPEPPEKRKKEGTPNRLNESRSESHRAVLQGYGFNDQLEPTIQVDEVANEVVIALFCLSDSVSEIAKNIMRYLGVPDSRRNVDKTRRKLMIIRTEWNAERKYGEDKYKKSAQLKTVKDVLKETETVLQSALAKLDNKSNVVDLKEGKSYSNKTFETVIRLKSLGVADEKVGEVMEVVGNLVGVTFETLPSPSTCRNFALSSLYLGRSHVKRRLDDFLERDDSLCLASDETTKGTAKLQAFGIHSPDGNFTCLGVQPVAEKSAQTAFNALEHLIKQLPDVPSDFFKKLLVKITCTMSDSARTEIKFNAIVEEARAKAVPEIVSGFHQLSDTEKSSFFQFSQFFCQLHVLANYTDVVLNALLGYELLETGNNKMGEASVFGLIKLVSQFFGQRGSGLHGILQIWEAWCKKYNICRFPFPAFHGNRFNIVFVLASRVFFHRFHLIEFIKECDCSKAQLKEVAKFLENEMIIDHLQILGLCDQLITGPLWRLAEGIEHIYDTCKYAEQLRKWLEGCAKSPIAFFDGSSPTPNLQESSPTNSTLLLEALLRRDPKETTCDCAEVVCNSSLLYFDKAFANFLSGGKHFINQKEMRKSTEAAPATNRNIESMFGLMSHYYDTKPNMRVDVRAAFTMLKKNNTFTWLQSLPETEQNEILSKSRAALNSLKKDASHCQSAIEIDLLQQMKDKNLIAARKQAKEERDRFKYTQDILSIGFWASSSDISAGLAKLSTEKQKREALTSQLRFRKFVIKQSAAAPMFSASAKSRPLTLQELIEKLAALIKNQHLSQQLLLMDHDYVGKRINQKISSKRSKGGFVEDIRIVGASKTIRVLFDGDSDPTTMNFDDFEAKLAAEAIVFVD